LAAFWNTIAEGLGSGSIYALMALGFAFIFRTSASFNFAQGALVTYGSLFAYSLYASHHLPLGLSVVCVVAIVAVLGVGVERIAIWPLSSRTGNSMPWLISTLGISVLLTGAAERIWGTQPLGVPNYVGPKVIHMTQGVYVATPYVIAFAAVIVFAIIIELFQRFTAWGRLMRAVGDNRLAVELAGANIMVLSLAAFAVGGALAGFAGFVIAPITYADSTSGYQLVILAFAAFAIGGFTSHWGAVVGGLVVGLAEALSGTYVGLEYQDLIVLAFMVVALLARPEGLFASRQRRLIL
jgi:branched-chain amino acid transport system permease protein